MVKKNKKLIIGAIVQARCNSTRLRNKILYKINNISLIEILVTRLKNSKKLNKVIVATSKHSSNNKLANILNRLVLPEPFLPLMIVAILFSTLKFRFLKTIVEPLLQVILFARIILQ